MTTLPRNESTKYKPKFTSPPLPSTEEFRLSTILNKHLQLESSEVVDALLNVNSNYQHDLRKEIRNALTVEQKIQYKNIHVAKTAQKLRKELHRKTKRLLQYLEDNHDDLQMQMANLQQLAIKCSGDFQRLASSVEQMSVSGPDPSKYPMLAQYFSSPKEPQDKNLQENGAEECLNSLAENDSETAHAQENDSQRGDLGGKNDGPGATGINTEEDRTESTELEFLQLQQLLQQLPPLPLLLLLLLSEMTAEAFEQLMDESISKYRSVQAEKEKNLIFSTRSKGPLKLLYSSQALAHSDMVKSETLKSPFVTAKLMATVLPTPQTLLHKKLRINAVPVQWQKSPLPLCSCQDLPAKAALAQTLFLANLAEGHVDEEAIDDVDSDSSDSETMTELDFLALRREFVERQNQELPPTERAPKHTPAHRTLKPKASILLHGRKLLTPKPVHETTFVSPYRASPRALFATPAAVGILNGHCDSRSVLAELSSKIDGAPEYS